MFNKKFKNAELWNFMVDTHVYSTILLLTGQ
jgi:hypothetical protein